MSRSTTAPVPTPSTDTRNLDNSVTITTPDGGTDTLTGVESIKIVHPDGTADIVPLDDLVPAIINGANGNDTINGTPGNDVVNAGGGNDSIIGGVGNDLLDGGTGNDTMAGGAGNDTYLVDSADDIVDETAPRFTTSVDTVRASSITYTAPEGVENVVLTGTRDRCDRQRCRQRAHR